MRGSVVDGGARQPQQHAAQDSGSDQHLKSEQQDVATAGHATLPGTSQCQPTWLRAPHTSTRVDSGTQKQALLPDTGWRTIELPRVRTGTRCDAYMPLCSWPHARTVYWVNARPGPKWTLM